MGRHFGKKKKILAANQHFLLFFPTTLSKCLFLWVFKSLTNQKFFKKPQWKALANNKINHTEIYIFILERVENIVGKGENAGCASIRQFVNFYFKHLL